PDTLDEADDRQDEGAPDADRVVGRDKTDRKSRQPCRQESGDQRSLAPDAIAKMAEERRPDRPRDKADGVDREGLQHADQRVGFGEEKLPEGEARDDAVEEEIVPLDRRADRARDYRPPQLRAMIGLGQRS